MTESLFICPVCKVFLTLEKSNLICSICGKTLKISNGLIYLSNSISISEAKSSLNKSLIMKFLSRATHPFRNFSFSNFNAKRIDKIYRKCLHDRETARKFVENYLPSDFQNKTGLVLDFGCGRGRHVAMLAQRGLYRVVGMDPLFGGGNKKIINYWRSISTARFVIGDDRSLEYFASDKFDICLCMLVLTYIESDNQAVANIFRILKRKGYLVLQVVNKNNLRTLLTGQYLEDASFKRYYTQKEIVSILEKHGFEIEKAWTEKLYLPIFTQFFQYITEVLFAGIFDSFLSRYTPPKFRGIINIVAQKP